MHFEEGERPFGIQIFGHDEDSLIAAAKIAESASPDFIDINWGCPVRKVVTKGAGSAILKDIPKMVRLTKAVVEAVKSCRNQRGFLQESLSRRQRDYQRADGKELRRAD